MPFTIQPSHKGKPHIIYEYYKFRESYLTKTGDVTWLCLGRTCNATIKTDAEKSYILSANSKHSGSHPVTMRSLSSPSTSVSSPSTGIASPRTVSPLRLSTDGPHHLTSSITASPLPVDDLELDPVMSSTLTAFSDNLKHEFLELKAENTRLKE